MSAPFGRVLLIEDEAAHAMLAERALRPFCTEVVRATSVQAALDSLEVASFDLLVSDLNLPGMPAGGPVKALRRVSPSVPLIVLTSSSSLAEAIEAMRLGASDFLVKNFDATFKDVLALSLQRIASAQEADRENQRLTRDRDILQRAIENSDDGLALVEPMGEVRYHNSSFKRFLEEFGATMLNVLTLDSTKMVNGATILESLKSKVGNLDGGGVWTTEVVGVGELERAYDLSLSGLREGNAHEVLVMWVRDIRERKRRERFQREILATTTHDLKGPLGAISLSCDVLLDRRTEDDRTRSVLERISSSANSAIQLIEEFLSVRRIEEGTFVLRPTAQTLSEVIARCVDTFRIPYETRGLRLITDVEEGLVACIDALGVERVVSNLLSNGSKFTPKGGTVCLSAHRTATGAVISVSDTGAGMEPAEVQNLFQRFSRLDKHAHVAGTGLGLFIVKSVVSAHGGAVDVTSVLGKGTTFDLFFPDKPPLNERGEVMCLDFA